ncbi:MAG: MgtC/SapB family protein [Ruminococcaceae bacterium]|nr:MgtC/SapB family protein [Oscillospiraceae bacterium]
MFEIRELTLLSVILRVVTAIILGGAIGLERGMKNRPAGLRTYMLVCIGSCIVMITNQYIFQIYQSGDPTRMAAQVVSGIGFLGAGTIIVTSHNQIRGLTTAAGLWASACVGIAIGIGFYEVALIGGAAIIVVLTLLHIWDKHMRNKSRSIDIYIELEKGISLGEFLRNAREAEITFSSVQLEHESVGRNGSLSFFATVKSKKRGNHLELMKKIRELNGVLFSESL